MSAPSVPDRRGQVKLASRASASFDGALEGKVGALCLRRSMRIYLQVRSSRVTEVRGTVVAELPRPEQHQIVGTRRPRDGHHDDGAEQREEHAQHVWLPPEAGWHAESTALPSVIPYHPWRS